MSGVDWKKPYRSMDASGSPEAAGSVGWEWINEVALELDAKHPGEVMIDSQSLPSDAGVMLVYLKTEVVAVASVFRDPVNFAILVRWRA